MSGKYRLIISDEDRKAVRYILTLYRSNTYKYVSKLELSKGAYKPAFTEDRVEELINLFDTKGCKPIYTIDDKLNFLFD